MTLGEGSVQRSTQGLLSGLKLVRDPWRFSSTL